MNVIKYINIFLAVIFMIVVIARFFIGFKNGVFKSLIRLAATVSAIIVAFMTYGIVFDIAGPKLNGLIVDALSKDPSLGDLAAMNSSIDAVVALAESLCGPLVYWSVFVTLDIIFAIVASILCRVLKIFPIKPLLLSRGIGSAVSILSGVLGFMLVLMPFAGYINTLPEVYNALYERNLIETPDEVTEVVDGLSSDGFFMSDFTAAVTKPIFKASASVKTEDGVTIRFTDEIAPLIKAINEISDNGMPDFSNMNISEAEKLSYLADLADESRFLNVVATEFITKSGEKWLKGESFLGINLKSAIEESYPGLSGALDGVLSKMANFKGGDVSKFFEEFLSLAKSLDKAMGYFDKISKVSDIEDLNALSDNLLEILGGIDESSKEVLLTMVTPEVFVGIGAKEEEAELYSEIATEILDAVSEMTDEEKKTEAEAINAIVTYAASSSETAPATKEIIGAIVSSEIILPAVKTVTEKNGDAEAIIQDVTEEQKAEINSAIEEYKAENPDADEEKLNAIKLLFGI